MPRPNLRLLPKLDAFEQAMTEYPPTTPQDRLDALRQGAILWMLGSVFAALLIACAGFWLILVDVGGVWP